MAVDQELPELEIINIAQITDLIYVVTFIIAPTSAKSKARINDTING